MELLKKCHLSECAKVVSPSLPGEKSKVKLKGLSFHIPEVCRLQLKEQKEALFSKGFGGIGFPISGLIYIKNIEAWKPADHICTFRCNQVSIAAARGAFDFIEEYKIEKYAQSIGFYLIEKLRALETENPFIGDVKGKGMMIGIEFVKDKTIKEPFPEYLKKLR